MFQPTESNNPIEMLCICERPCSAYFCTACGGFFYGRIKQTCKQHPSTIYLMDMDVCVHCQAGSYMVRPVQLDRQTVLDITAADSKMKYMEAEAERDH